MELEANTLKNHEAEVKFRVEESILNDWKQLVSALKEQEGFDYKEFIYVDSDDVYYTNVKKPKDVAYQFIRHRFSDDKKNKRVELTSKKKLNDSNNILRKEWNIRVDSKDTKKEDIAEWISEGLDYTYDFTISKYVQIYKFADATLPFYTVIDEKGDRKTFIEIEVDEDLLSTLTEDEAWGIIRKYEAVLAPLGINPKKRLRLSLYEMYTNL